MTDAERYPGLPEAFLEDLYELYFPPRDEEMYLQQMEWTEWADLT